jgi:adenylate cyclase
VNAIDDLKVRLDTPELTQAAKAAVWNQLSALYLESDRPAALIASEQAYQLASECGDIPAIASSYENKALFYLKEGDNVAALFHFSEALKLWESAGNDTEVATICKRMGNIYLRSGNYEKALTSYKKAIPILIKIDDKRGLADIYTNSGIVFGFQGKYSDSLQNHYEALRIYEAQNNIERLCRSLLNIGSIYMSEGNRTEALKAYLKAINYSEEKAYNDISAKLYVNIGNIYLMQGDQLKALEYQNKALNINKEIDDQSGLSSSYHNIGNIYFEQGDDRKALEYYQQSLKIREELRDKRRMIESYIVIGTLYEREGEYEQAEIYIQKALKQSTNLGAKDSMRDAYRILALIYSQQKHFERAYELQKKHYDLERELLNTESAHRISQISTQYEMEQKEKEMEIERLKNVELKKAYQTIESEKKRSEDLLLNILPEPVADELKMNGKYLPRNFDLVTILFTDIKDFTALCEKLAPQDLISLIDECFSAFDGILDKHNIEKIKTIGDAYMCAGGLPIANTTNPLDVVRAGIEMQAYMAKHKEKRIQQGLPFFEIRLGIHTGPVMAGIIGEKKFAYDIWGDTVNIAARMESSGEPGKVNISGDTYQLVKDHVNCLYRGKVRAKNKGEVDMYFVQ